MPSSASYGFGRSSHVRKGGKLRYDFEKGRRVFWEKDKKRGRLIAGDIVLLLLALYWLLHGHRHDHEWAWQPLAAVVAVSLWHHGHALWRYSRSW